MTEREAHASLARERIECPLGDPRGANGRNGATGKIWKNVALFLAGCVCTLLGVWATHVRGEVTREQVNDIVESRSLYNGDRLLLLESNKRQDAKLEELAQQVQQLREQMARIEQKVSGRNR